MFGVEFYFISSIPYNFMSNEIACAIFDIKPIRERQALAISM